MAFKDPNDPFDALKELFSRLIGETDAFANFAKSNLTWIATLRHRLENGRNPDPECRKPDWAYWRNLGHAELWKAFALAADVDPRDPEVEKALRGKLSNFPLPNSAPVRIPTDARDFHTKASNRREGDPLTLSTIDLSFLYLGSDLLRANYKGLPADFPQPCNDPPNWRKWAKISTAYLWEVVTLSVNINPDFLTWDEKFSRGLARRLTFPPDFFSRLQISESHLDDPDDGLPTEPNSEHLSGDKAYARVRLDVFAAFAERRHWELPAQFPRPAAQTEPARAPMDHGVPKADEEAGKGTGPIPNATKMVGTDVARVGEVTGCQATTLSSPQPQEGNLLSAVNSEPSTSPAELAPGAPLAEQTAEDGDEDEFLDFKQRRTRLAMIAGLAVNADLEALPKKAEEIAGKIKGMVLEKPAYATILEHLKLAAGLCRATVQISDDETADETAEKLRNHDSLAIIAALVGKVTYGDVARKCRFITSQLKAMKSTWVPEMSTLVSHLNSAIKEFGLSSKKLRG